MFGLERGSCGVAEWWVYYEAGGEVKEWVWLSVIQPKFLEHTFFSTVVKKLMNGDKRNGSRAPITIYSKYVLLILT